MLTVLVVSLGGVAFALSRFGGLPFWTRVEGLALHEVAMAAAVLVAAGVVATTKSRFTALLALGVVGYGVALFFVFYGAPDLAIIQILVETLALVLFVLIVDRLPGFTRLSSTRRRIFDGILAIAGGAVMTALGLKAVHVEAAPPISTFFSENALAAYGRNVVNVILVDFRALDTLGEIVVVVFAALGVAALLCSRAGKKGLMIFGHAVNLTIFTAAGLTRGNPPLIAEGAAGPVEPFADPLPQALILTAIVIGFGVLAFTLALARRAHEAIGTDDLDAMTEGDE